MYQLIERPLVFTVPRRWAKELILGLRNEGDFWDVENVRERNRTTNRERAMGRLASSQAMEGFAASIMTSSRPPWTRSDPPMVKEAIQEFYRTMRRCVTEIPILDG